MEKNNVNPIELTEREKEAYKAYSKKFIDDPLSSVEEGLVLSYYAKEDDREFEQAVYEFAKRLLKEVAKKRKIIIKDEETFEIEDIVEKNNLEDFDLKYYNDYDLLKKYIDTKTKDMNVVEIETFYNKMGGRVGMQDCFREFMTRYIPKIISNIYELYAELSEEIVMQDDSNFVYEEGKEQEDIYWADKDFEEQEKNEWDDDFEWVSNDDCINELEDQQNQNQKKAVSNEGLTEYIKFLNSYQKLSKYKINGQKVMEKLDEIVKAKKLNEFYDNMDFFENFKNIMNHDKEKHNYLFHGTQCLEDAESIMNEGLAMMRNDLSSTTYSELSMDDVILYSRGFLGEIGKDAIVIIDQPISDDGKKKDIVQKMDEDKEINFCPSGLQGLDGKPQYQIDSKYIIGFVNKKDKKIIYNTKYYDYEKSKQKKHIKENSTDEEVIMGLTENYIGKLTINVDTFKKDKAKERIQSDLQKNQEIEKNK